MINEEERGLYNTYLAVSRASRNKPFTIRKNFDGFENTKEYSYIQKIARFLAQFPQIKRQIYFEAPFKLYKDLEYIDLRFYATQRAIKAYTVYMQQLQEESPDSDHHIEFIKNSLRFIGMFCIKNKISLDEYPTYSAGATYSWMKHIREHNVSIYVMFDFPGIIDIIRRTPNDELDLLLGNIAVGLAGYKNKYDVSKRARKVVSEGFRRIRRVIDDGGRRDK